MTGEIHSIVIYDLLWNWDSEQRFFFVHPSILFPVTAAELGMLQPIQVVFGAKLNLYTEYIIGLSQVHSVLKQFEVFGW